MRRRNSGDGAAVAGREGRDDGRWSGKDAGHGWATGWADPWGESEQERVARWLTAKGRATVHVPAGGDLAGRGAAVRPIDPWEVDLREERSAPRAAATEAVVPAVVVPPVELLHARTALEAELAHLEDDRRRLAAALEGERAEADRVRRDLSVAASMLHEHIARLEDDRRRVQSSVESAMAEAEQARADEQAARAALEGALAEARAAEAKHFDVWIALDREVTALAARRRRLRALNRRRRIRARTPGS